MKGKQYIIFLFALTLLILLIGNIRAQLSINLPIGIDQAQLYDLTTSLGVITSNLAVSSLSQFNLNQPFEYQKINATLSNRQVISSAEKKRKDDIWIQVQVYKDPQQTGIMKNEFYFSVLLMNLKAQESDEVIQEIYKFNIQQTFGMILLDAQVIMLNQSEGLLLIISDETSYISYFKVDDALSYGYLYDLQTTAINIYSTIQKDQGKLIFTTIQKNDNQFEAVIREFLVPQLNVTVISTSTICQQTNVKPQIIKNDIYTVIKCIQETNYFYESLYLLPEQNLVQKLTSPKISNENLGISPFAIFSKNNLQILEKFPQTNIFQLTQLIPQLNKNSFSYQIEQYPIESQISSLLGHAISDQGFITIFTSTHVIGISVSTKKIILLFDTPQIEDYQPNTIQYIGKQSFISYQNTKKPEITTFGLINLSIPILFIQQNSDQKQFYLISQQNTSIVLAEIATNIVPLNQTELLETEIKKKIIMKSNRAIVEIPLEKYVIGPNLLPIVQNFTSAGKVKIETEIKKINKINVKYLEFFEGKIINKIYSTSSNQFLADTLNEQTKQRYLVLYEMQLQNTEYQLLIKAKLQTRLQIEYVDTAGFFTLKDTSSSVHKIYGYVDVTNSFQEILTDCDIREDMMFSSDPLHNSIAVLCNKQIYLYSYFAENSYGKILFTYVNTFLTKFSDTVSMNLNSNGQLILASFTNIKAFDINSKQLIGTVKVGEQNKPFDEKYVGGFILLDSSFIVAIKISNSWKISQYSYNNFDGTYAKLICVFDTDDYIIKIGSLNQGISGILNNNALTSSEEYLVVDAKDPQSFIPLKLVYRTSGASIEGQTYAIIPTDQNKFTFFSNSYIGEVESQNFKAKFYSLSYQVNLQVKIILEQQDFYDQSSVQESFIIEFKKDKNLKINLEIEIEKNSLLQENQSYVELSLKKGVFYQKSQVQF